MKVKEAFIQTIKELKSIYSEGEAGSVSRLLFEDLGFDVGPVSGDLDKNLDEENRNRLENMMLRLSKHEPVQYVLGYSWFYGHKFLVSPDTLIPRQETEFMVDLVIKKLDKSYAGKILDIGTGSGAIACSLSHQLTSAKLYASDISEKALITARKNAANIALDIIFIHDDILRADLSNYPTGVDMIISNPPYVRNSEKAKMEKNVLNFEPDLALFVADEDPLIYYREISRFSSKMLSPAGQLYLEINEALGKDTAKLISDFGFRNIKIIRDLNNKERIIYAEKG